jgi:hypothetical protein
MVYAGLLAIAIKKNDPNAVLMVCKTGTVAAKVQQLLYFTITPNRLFSIFILSGYQ